MVSLIRRTRRRRKKRRRRERNIQGIPANTPDRHHALGLGRHLPADDLDTTLHLGGTVPLIIPLVRREGTIVDVRGNEAEVGHPDVTGGTIRGDICRLLAEQVRRPPESLSKRAHATSEPDFTKTAADSTIPLLVQVRDGNRYPTVVETLRTDTLIERSLFLEEIAIDLALALPYHQPLLHHATSHQIGTRSELRSLQRCQRTQPSSVMIARSDLLSSSNKKRQSSKHRKKHERDLVVWAHSSAMSRSASLAASKVVSLNKCAAEEPAWSSIPIDFVWDRTELVCTSCSTVYLNYIHFHLCIVLCYTESYSYNLLLGVFSSAALFFSVSHSHRSPHSSSYQLGSATIFRSEHRVGLAQRATAYLGVEIRLFSYGIRPNCNPCGAEHIRAMPQVVIPDNVYKTMDLRGRMVCCPTS